MTRRLALRRESLAPLTMDELSEVAAGNGPTISCIACLVIITTRIADEHSLRPTQC